MVYKLNGGDWNHGIWIDCPSIGNGISSSQLTFTPSFFRGVGSTTNQNKKRWKITVLMGKSPNSMGNFQ